MTNDELRKIPQTEFMERYKGGTVSCCDCHKNPWAHEAVSGTPKCACSSDNPDGHAYAVCESCYAKHPPGPPPEVPGHDPPLEHAGKWAKPDPAQDFWLTAGGNIAGPGAIGHYDTNRWGGNRWILRPKQEWPKWGYHDSGCEVYRATNETHYEFMAQRRVYPCPGHDTWKKRSTTGGGHECTHAHCYVFALKHDIEWPDGWEQPAGHEEVGREPATMYMTRDEAMDKLGQEMMGWPPYETPAQRRNTTMETQSKMLVGAEKASGFIGKTVATILLLVVKGAGWTIRHPVYRVAKLGGKGLLQATANAAVLVFIAYLVHPPIAEAAVAAIGNLLSHGASACADGAVCAWYGLMDSYLAREILAGCLVAAACPAGFCIARVLDGRHA